MVEYSANVGGNGNEGMFFQVSDFIVPLVVTIKQ